jgi:hypothetical protein
MAEKEALSLKVDRHEGLSDDENLTWSEEEEKALARRYAYGHSIPATH